MKIPFLSISPQHFPLRADMLAAVARVIGSSRLVLGEEVAAFEKDYPQYNKTAHCIGVANGLDALALRLRALEIGSDDEVIVPFNTYIYIATWLAATPVPVEPERVASNIDPNLIEVATTLRTRAIMAVHLYGRACRMDANIVIPLGTT